MRQSESRFRSLVEQLPAVVFHAALGEQDNEVYVSPQIEALLGFTQQEWLTNPLLWYSQLHPDDHDVVIEAFTRGIQCGGPFRAEVRFLSREGKEVWILGEARLIRDEMGRLAYFQGVGFDITPSKRAQQELALAQRAKAEAAQMRADAYSAANVELAELNEQLREAEAIQRAMLEREHEVVERLTQLDRDKTDFVSSVTHELRTPVTSMLGYLELLDDGDAGPLNPDQQRMLEAIGRNSRRLLSRIEDLLTVSGVEAGAMRLQAAPMSVRALVDSATSAMVPTMRGRDLTLHGRRGRRRRHHRRRRREARPGADQPAQQRHQVHPRRRAHHHSGTAERWHGHHHRRRHRHRHSPSTSSPGSSSGSSGPPTPRSWPSPAPDWAW